MKKLLCVIMAALMLMGTAFAEEEFTLHNGTKFGMTTEEVSEMESSNGNYFNDNGYGSLVSTHNTVAGQPNTTISYVFRDGKLFSMQYEFEFDNDDYTSQYNTIEEGLIKKYGETTYNSISSIVLPIDNGHDPTMMPHMDKIINRYSPLYGDVKDYETSNGMWSQRIVFLETGEAAYIIHTAWTYTSYTGAGDTIDTVAKNHILEWC